MLTESPEEKEITKQREGKPPYSAAVDDCKAIVRFMGRRRPQELRSDGAAVDIWLREKHAFAPNLVCVSF